MNEQEQGGDISSQMQRILYEVKKVVVGQDHFLERVLVAILAQGHWLVEGVPGLAKTLTVKTLARTVRGTFRRIQFTPDLVPADLVGTRVYNQKTGEFTTSLGPVFTNLLLADEINRAPAKVQSALLEVMQEYHVTIAGETYRVPEPFLVMATQNPIETEGTYPLPEAQVDRFMMKVLVGYPSEEEEFVIVNRVTGAGAAVAAVASTEELLQLQRQCRTGYVDPSLVQYAVRLVSATRKPDRLDGLLYGDYRTLFRGFGVDLADLREYQFHDDVRHIDWNVTARLQTPYVRVYNEERELTAWFLLDLSPSVDFGSQDIKKRAVATELVAVLARAFSRHGNRIGALFYGGSVDTVIPARTGRRHVLHIVHKMLSRPELARSAATDLQQLLHSAYQVMPRRSLVFVVSDFISLPGWERPLAQLARRHEVVAVRLYDRLEMELPDLGLVVMQDAETGDQVVVDTHDRRFRKRFAAVAERREADVRASFRKAGVDALELATDDNLTDAILRFAVLRKRRSQLAACGSLPQHLEQA